MKGTGVDLIPSIGPLFWPPPGSVRETQLPGLCSPKMETARLFPGEPLKIRSAIPVQH
jgi:hypothetical protein